MRRAAAAGLLLLSATAAHAQPLRRPQPLPLPAPVEKPPDVGDLRGRFGVVVAQRLLGGTEPEGRLRAIRRLAAIGTAQAIDMLIQAMDGPNGSPPLRERLEAVRGLARHGDDDGPRRILVSALRDVSGEGELATLVRDTAALSLASFGGPRGADALFALVRQGGAAAASSARALVARPPANVESLFGPRAPFAAPVAVLAAAMGDLRAIPWLRRAVREGDPATRAASLVAMAALGDGQAELVARGWAGEADPLARVAAARALATVAPSDAEKLVAALLADKATREAGLDLALALPGPELVAPLTAITADASVGIDELRRAITALGRSGGGSALLGLTGRADVATDAALALALSPGDSARGAIETLLRDAARRKLGVRAAVVRALALGERAAGVREAIAALLPTDRETATFADVALGHREPDDPVLLRDDALVPAIARAALARSEASLVRLGPALAAASSPRTRDALGVALLVRGADAPVPTTTLLAWVEEGGALAPLAARAVAARDDDATRSRLDALALSGDAQIRAHVAAGLGASDRPDATGRLATAYAGEVDRAVRRAVVRALAQRAEGARVATLELAATLDPDASIRALARAALAGVTPHDRTRGPLVAWLTTTGEAAAVRFELPDGLVAPLVPDADGTLLVPGLPPGISRARVAAAP